jgi:hypothetical protein
VCTRKRLTGIIEIEEASDKSRWRKREHDQDNTAVHALVFVPAVGVYVSVYEALELPLKSIQDKK